jgi:hypothetical protein
LNKRRVLASLELMPKDAAGRAKRQRLVRQRFRSRFASVEMADSLLGEMSESIGEGSDGFTHHTRFEAGDREIHMVLGQGQVHFFFARDGELTWLGIDAAQARAGLSEILGLTEEILPGGVTLDGTAESPGADPESGNEPAGPTASEPGGNDDG